jgi:hypothetical protein
VGCDAHDKSENHEHLLNRVILYLNDSVVGKMDEVRASGPRVHVEENVERQSLPVPAKSSSADGVSGFAERGRCHLSRASIDKVDVFLPKSRHADAGGGSGGRGAGHR